MKLLIEVTNVSKRFGDTRALQNVSLTIEAGSVFGLVGTNGAGKSSLLRILAGVVRADEGKVTIDGEVVGDNKESNKKFFFIADDPYFFANATPLDMGGYFKKCHSHFDQVEYEKTVEKFALPYRGKIKDFSKGMRKQLCFILALAAKTPYIFCDETFDGLDPVMRQGVKSLLANALTERNLGLVVASHSLRELEDFCDHVGMLHKGGVLLSEDLDTMKLSLHKIQCVFQRTITREHFADLDILQFKRRGSLYTIVVRGEEEHILEVLEREKPLFSEVLPLSLEEIFISETGVKGYDIKKLVL